MTLLLVSIAGGVGCVVRYLFEYVVRRTASDEPTVGHLVAAKLWDRNRRRLRGLSAVANGDANIRAITLDWILRGNLTHGSSLRLLRFQ